MFAREISIHLKPNTLAEFTTALEKEIVPMLRKQAGFRDEMVFAVDGSNTVNAISLWDTKEQAETYAKDSYPDVLKALDKFLDGPPKVRMLTVINSTAHKLTRASVVVAA
jgi:heme-degrading monooxygenase HmoA